MELTGTIIAVLPAQSGVSQRTGNPWMSQDYVIEVPGQYPRKCTFRIFGEDRIKQFSIQSGEQNVTVQFDIDAHEYNGRWFNEVRAYNVIRANQQAAAPAPAATQAPQQADMFGGQQPQNAAPAQNPFPPAQEQGDNPDDRPF
jgi:hypothetical protein